MTPRVDVEWIDADEDLEEILRAIHECRHEQLLVGKGTIDEPVGMILKKDLLDQVLDAKALDPMAVIRQPIALHEAMPFFRVLEQFKRAPVRLATILDEYGVLQGIVTQTDLLEAAGATGKAVNVKKGQWMAPEAMRGAVEKIRLARPEAPGPRPGSAESRVTSHESRIAVTERGSFFGYGDLAVDMRSIPRMRAATGCPVIFDGTHSVQRPGLGEGGASGGAREFIPSLTLAAVAAGADGLFLETHPDPDHAPSDGPNMLPLRDLEVLVRRALAVREACRR
jgi:3-deoxy-8-phosphooctulonate synthase